MTSRCTRKAKLFATLALLIIILSLLFSHLCQDQLLHGDSEDELDSLDILMPGTAPSTASGNVSSGGSLDAYLCTSVRLPNDSDILYLARFEPLLGASGSGLMMHVHHMLLASCDRLPFGVTDAEDGVGVRWNCGVMTAAAADSTLRATPPMEMCSGGLRYIYAYAMGAPALRLPHRVAYPVGGEHFGGRRLVLQVHYTSMPSSANAGPSHSHHGVGHHHRGGSPRTAGVRVGFQRRAPQRLASMHLSATGGLIPARSVAHLTAGCPYTGEAVLRPFAFRVHTHRLGRVVSVYRVRYRHQGGSGGRGGSGQWTLIGRANPQLMQMFYPVNGSGLELLSGDCLATLCVMENAADRLVHIGPTADDEMCNAYVMYWYQREDSSRFFDHGCTSRGSSDLWVEAPDWVLRQAATVPGSDRFLPHTAGY